MTGEEMTGPPGPKILRLLSFVGAGVVCAFAINKWGEFESKRAQQNEQQQHQLTDDSKSTTVQEVLK